MDGKDEEGKWLSLISFILPPLRGPKGLRGPSSTSLSVSPSTLSNAFQISFFFSGIHPSRGLGEVEGA